MKPKITPRQHKILRATVRSYVATAEPVGSKTLAEIYDLGVSTATIRNDLASLEQGGLLFQPHTSAGRIPSDSGYRVYVNDLLELWEPDQATLEERWTGVGQHRIRPTLIEQLGEQVEDDIDSMLHRAARILARLSGCIALISTPQLQTVVLRHLQLVSVDQHRIMMVIVTDSYRTHSVIVNWGEEGNESPEATGDRIPLPPVSLAQLEEELQVLSNFLTLKLRGKTLADLQDLSWLELDRQFRCYAEWLGSLLKVASHKCLRPSLGSFLTAGVNELMRQPEFTQTQQIQTVVQLLEEEQDSLGDVLGSRHPGELRVFIGAENPLEPIRHCTLITSTYCRGDEPMGSVSLLGPTRMVYEQTLGSVRALVEHLSLALS